MADSKPVTAQTYVPVFMDNVEQTFTASGQVQKINPVYCLTMDSAKELAEILADLRPKIVEADPVPQRLGSISYSTLVPWFQFPSGAAVNCGQEADYWAKAGPNGGANAERDCRKDIQSAEQLFEIEGNGQYPNQLKR